jgi:hypothetical protein
MPWPLRALVSQFLLAIVGQKVMVTRADARELLVGDAIIVRCAAT